MERIKWMRGKPTADGMYQGNLGGHALLVIIETQRIGKEHNWWAVGTYRDISFDLSGRSGGVQRAVSCIRDECLGISRRH